jgi:CheY-like chemotaxis protein
MDGAKGLAVETPGEFRGRRHRDSRRGAPACCYAGGCFGHRPGSGSCRGCQTSRGRRQAGGTATTAGSADDALAQLDRNVPDVMVADLGMPGMDGLALIEAIRRRPDESSRLPAIALTAYARSQDRIRALSSGFQRHLAKPIDHVQLVAAVMAVVSRQRSSEPSA